MNYFKYLLVALFAISMFSSCEKDNIDTTTIEKEEIIPEERTSQNSLMSRTRSGENESGLDMGCIIVNFPFSLVDVDGVEYLIESDESFFGSVDSTSVIEIVDFVYPLTITLNGETVVVENGESLGEVFSECLPDGGWTEEIFPAYLIGEDNSCYSLAYPVNLMNEKGETVSIQNEVDFIEATSKEFMIYVFPIKLSDVDGSSFEVADTDELIELLLSCNDLENNNDSTYFDWANGFEYLACFHLELPYSVVVEDGKEVLIEAYEQFGELLLSGSVTAYAYPLTLKDEDGETVVINSEDELYETLEECYEPTIGLSVDLQILLIGAMSIDSINLEACYTINWPIDVSYGLEGEEPSIIAVNSEEDILDLGIVMVELLYPVTVTLLSDSTEVILSDPQDVFTLIDDCL